MDRERKREKVEERRGSEERREGEKGDRLTGSDQRVREGNMGWCVCVCERERGKGWGRVRRGTNHSDEDTKKNERKRTN